MAPYYSVDPHSLYQSCLSAGGEVTPIGKARAWVEAENTFEVWKVINNWFNRLQDGTYWSYMASPFWTNPPDKTALTQDVVELFVKELDEDFMLEKSRFQGKKPPEFSRLPFGPKFAFVQECYKIMKSSKAINAEADERLANGEKMPPEKMKK